MPNIATSSASCTTFWCLYHVKAFRKNMHPTHPMGKNSRRCLYTDRTLYNAPTPLQCTDTCITTSPNLVLSGPRSMQLDLSHYSVSSLSEWADSAEFYFGLCTASCMWPAASLAFFVMSLNSSMPHSFAAACDLLCCRLT